MENNNFLYKLTDFGLSKQLSLSNKTSTFAGTVEYLAPEIRNNLI